MSYDFSSPSRLSREQSRLLEIAFETLARQWTTQLVTSVRCPAHVALVSVEERTYDAYVAALPSPTPMVLFTPDASGRAGTGGTGVLQLACETALSYVDHALGGPGGEQPHRDLTDIEVSLIQAFCERALSALGYAFASVASLSPTVDSVEQNPQLTQAARASDVVVVAEFTVRVGAVERASTLMLPLTPLQERMATSSHETSRSERELARERDSLRILKATLPDVPVDVRVRLGAVPAAPDRVLALEVGDLLRLPHPFTRPLDVVVADVVLAKAVAATTGNRAAAMIVAPEEDHR